MFVHGNNISQKQNHKTKYRDDESRRYLAEIRLHYEQWKSANQSLIGPGSKAHPNDLLIMDERVKILNDYKDFLDQQHYAAKFDSRSNLHSSVLEEFMYYLFRDLVQEISPHALMENLTLLKMYFFAHLLIKKC